MEKKRAPFVRRVSQWSKPDPNIHFSRLKGAASEKRFLEVCNRFLQQGQFPEWVIDFEKGTAEDEPKKIDMWASTTDGLRIPIQIKSAKRDVEKFKKLSNYRHILCIAAGPKVSDEHIFLSTKEGLIELYDSMRTTRAVSE